MMHTPSIERKVEPREMYSHFANCPQLPACRKSSESSRRDLHNRLLRTALQSAEVVRQEWMDVGDVTLLREEVTILVYWTDGRGEVFW